MNAELLATLSGIALSLLFSYIPGFADWFAARDGIQKRLIMLGFLLAIAVAIFGLACAQALSYVTCDQPGAIAALNSFIAAAIANQATFALSPQVKR